MVNFEKPETVELLAETELTDFNLLFKVSWLSLGGWGFKVRRLKSLKLAFNFELISQELI